MGSMVKNAEGVQMTFKNGLKMPFQSESSALSSASLAWLADHMHLGMVHSAPSSSTRPLRAELWSADRWLGLPHIDSSLFATMASRRVGSK